MLRSVSLSKSAGCKPKFQLPESAIEPLLFVRDHRRLQSLYPGLVARRLRVSRLAEQLVRETCLKQWILPNQLTLHADRGSSMKSKPLAMLLADLGVTKTHSRPRVSNDNPNSESQFKTMKYCPDFPDFFGSKEDTRAWVRPFFDWYNNEHYHSSLGLLTPATVHYGQAAALLEKRQRVLDAAYAAHPERFVKKTSHRAVIT